MGTGAPTESTPTAGPRGDRGSADGTSRSSLAGTTADLPRSPLFAARARPTVSLSPGFVLAPSLLSADFADLAGAIRAVEEGEAGALHLDVMDGHFVPNITFGPALVKAVRARTRLPLDIHLMITDPLRYIRDFAQAGGDTLAFHLESSSDPHQVLERIRAEGKRPGIALRPKTPLSAMEPFLSDVDEVLVMTVEPGFSGQLFHPEVVPKIAQARKALDGLGSQATLSVDGGVTPETIGPAARAGANFFVCGNAVFSPDHSPQEGLARLREGYRKAMDGALR